MMAQFTLQIGLDLPIFKGYWSLSAFQTLLNRIYIKNPEILDSKLSI